MPGRKTIAITDRQFRLLHLLWQHGAATVRELQHHLPGGSRLPYTTVLGLLQNMEKAGLVTHRQEGLTYRYEPTLTREQATGKLLGDFVSRFFSGSARALVLGLVDAEQLSAKELRDLERGIARQEAMEAADRPEPSPPRRAARKSRRSSP